ncbi:MAG: ankyrin repeat domain-containing protein [Hyphomonas sp.]|nr:ankyrin repeat domain-containing protein [Hyphomonas sp.]
MSQKVFSGSKVPRAPLENSQIQALIDAIDANDRQRLGALLRPFGDVDAPLANGWTCLHSAAARNRADIVSYLIAKGADIERLGTPISRTPLQVAVAEHALDAAKALLDGGADIDGCSENGRTALHWAIAADRFKQGNQAFDYVMGHNPDVDAADEHGVTPVDMAIDYGNLEKMEMLLQRGANPNARIDGETRLHRGVPFLSKDHISVLLRFGADTGSFDKDGRRPVDIAIERRRYDLVDILMPRLSLGAATRAGSLTS